MLLSIIRLQQLESVLICLLFFTNLFSIYPACVSLRFLSLWHDVFYCFWKNLTTVSSNISSLSFSFLFLAFQLKCLDYLFFLLLLFVCFSLCFSLVISIDISSSLLIFFPLSCVKSIMSSSKAFFIFATIISNTST